jgi:GTP-binding protein
MAFVDIAKVLVSAGSGGNGLVSFRREKFVARGGPDGGDGGDGGDIVCMASNSEDTLAKFRYQKELKAEDGKPGEPNKRHGRSAHDLIVRVPVGTTVVDEGGRILADLTYAGQMEVIAAGGKGGYGNAHFKSSVRQAPKVAEKGEPGETFTAVFEIKMIADVGLVGLPNAGKSTLLAKNSNANPEVANYAFTTLTPNLGVIDLGHDTSFLMADIPGLIEGASSGKGLGDEFLRHVERTKVLLHLIDCWSDDVVADYKTIDKELKDYSQDLAKKPRLIVLTKIDGLDDDIVEDQIAKLTEVLPKKAAVYAVSSHDGNGIKKLFGEAMKIVEKSRRAEQKAQDEKEAAIPVITAGEDRRPWTVEQTEKGYLISSDKFSRFARRTDFDNEDGVYRLRDILRRNGVLKELEKQGIEPGDKIIIGTSGEITY